VKILSGCLENCKTTLGDNFLPHTVDRTKLGGKFYHSLSSYFGRFGCNYILGDIGTTNFNCRTNDVFIDLGLLQVEPKTFVGRFIIMTDKLSTEGFNSYSLTAACK